MQNILGKIVAILFISLTLVSAWWLDLRRTEEDISRKLEHFSRRRDANHHLQEAIHNGSIAQDLISLFEQSEPKNRCNACRKTLILMRKVSTHAKYQLPDILQQLCASKQLENNKACKLDFYLQPLDSDHSSFVNDLSNALTLMNPRSLDAEYFCHYLLQGLCPMPETPSETLEFSIPPPINTPKRYHNTPAVKQSGKTFKVLHLSDIHLSEEYLVGSEANCQGFMCCTKESSLDPFDEKSIPAPVFGHYKCDAPRSLVESSLASVQSVAKELKYDYEFAIFTGDMVDHNPVWISYNQSVREEEAVMKYMKKYLGNVPVYSALGNHDTYPFSQVAQKKSGFGNLFSFNPDLMAHLWQEYGWIDSHTAQDVRTNYGGYAVTTRRGLRVISLNSNFWYRWNFYNYWDMENPDTSGTLKFLKDELVMCEKRGQRAWIIAHVPPGGITDEAMPISSQALVQIFERFSPNTIAALFFGHTHQDEFTILYAGNDKRSITDALAVAWIGPSVTPLSNYNPSWRYYEVDTESFEIMNSYTYYAQLNDTFEEFGYNGSRPLKWSMEYSARKEYDIDNSWPQDKPLNGKFWHKVAKNIRDNSTFAQMYMNNAYRRSPHVPKCQSNQCRYENYCYTTSMSVPQAIECRDKYNVTTRKFLTGAPTYPMPRPVRELLDISEE